MEAEPLVPEIVRPEPDPIRVLRWSFTPRIVKFIKVGTALPGLAFAGWLLQNFLQLRGVVNILASRIDLLFLFGALVVLSWALTIGTKHKSIWRGGLYLAALAAILGLDWWAPKPTRGQPAKSPIFGQYAGQGNREMPPSRREPGTVTSSGPLPPTQRKGEQERTPGVDEAVLLLDCNDQALPVKFGPGDPIHVLDIQLLNGIGEYFIGGTGKGSLWPSPDSLGDFAYRCEFANYSDDPVFGIAMTFSVAFLETTKDQNGGWRGDGARVTGGHSHHIDISKVEGHGGKFVFYIWNGTGQFATVTAPLYAEVELAKEPRRARIRLKQPNSAGSLTMHLNPRKELLR